MVKTGGGGCFSALRLPCKRSCQVAIGWPVKEVLLGDLVVSTLLVWIEMRCHTVSVFESISVSVSQSHFKNFRLLVGKVPLSSVCLDSFFFLHFTIAVSKIRFRVLKVTFLE